MPRPANALADLEAGHALTQLNDVADEHMARHAGEEIAHGALRNAHVGVADTTGKHLDKDLAGARVLKLDIDNLEGHTGGLANDGLVGLREGRHSRRSRLAIGRCSHGALKECS